MSFSADDLKKVADLSNRKVQIQNWQKEIADKIAVLEDQRAASEREMAEIVALLEGDYKELAEAARQVAEMTAPKEPAKPKFTVYNR